MIQALASLLMLTGQIHGFQEFRNETLKKEKEGAWKRIAWETDPARAVETARREDKPILALLTVGHMGRKDAADC